MYHLSCGINSLLHSVNLILFTVLLVHLILHISPRHSHHLCSHHLSLPQPFTPDLKLISFTNPFLHSLSGSISTAFKSGMDLCSLLPIELCRSCLFVWLVSCVVDCVDHCAMSSSWSLSVILCLCVYHWVLSFIAVVYWVVLHVAYCSCVCMC